MEAIAGMPVTPRRVQGPGFELVGLLGDRGHHTALWYPPSSPCRADGVRLPEGARAFLERPAVPGIARLTHVDREVGAVVYASGEVWSLAEVVASLRRRGEVPGVRAGVELAWRVSALLAQARDDAAAVRLAAHGAIDPWRIALRKDGQVYLLGYGMGAGASALRGTGPQLREALRYAPPERLEGRPEDSSSDLFALGLVALECMVGEPVYRGDEQALRRQATEAEGDRRLHGWRDRLPAEVVEVFARAVRRDADGRWQDAAAFAEATRRVLASPALTGPSLYQCMSSSSVDPPHRFVGLSEERGEVDSVSRTREENLVKTDTEATAERRPWRHVALGGRHATRSTPVRVLWGGETQWVDEEMPARAGAATAVSPQVPAVLTPLAPMDLQIPTPSGPRTLIPDDVDEVTLVAPQVAAASVSATLAPVDEADEAEEAAAEETFGGFASEDTFSGETLDLEEVEAPSLAATIEADDQPTVYLHAAQGRAAEARRRAPARPASMGAEPRPFSQDEAPTIIDVLSKDLVTLSLAGPDGHAFRQVFDGSFTTSEAAEEVVRDRGLAERDLAGHTVWGWRLAGADGPCPHDLTVDQLVGREDLVVERVAARTFRVRVRLPSEVEIELGLSGALRARHVVAALRDLCGLRPRRWRLVVDGVQLASARLLDEVLRDGAIVELTG
jgi:hypothetical protein